MPAIKRRRQQGGYPKRRTGGYYPKGVGRRSTMYLSRKTGLVRRVGQEVNYHDVADANYPLNTTGALVLLNEIPQGAQATSRIGRKILLKSIQVRGNLAAGPANINCKAAWMIVYDKRPTGALPNITDILTAADSEALTNTQNQGRFQIICRKDYSVCGSTANSASTNAKSGYNVEKFIKISKRVTYKAAGTGEIGDIEQGALYLVTVGNNAATNVATTDLRFRVRFYDI